MSPRTANCRRACAVVTVCACVMAMGCTTDPVAARDEEARSEVQRLRLRVSKLEDDAKTQTRKIDTLAQLLDKSAADVADLKKERAEADAAAQAAETKPAVASPEAASAPAPALAAGTDAAAAAGRTAIAFDEFTRKVQQALKRAGYDPGPVDGKKGSNTTRAIQSFQQENNIPTSGMADEATWALLKRYLE
jgi:septal ring factor EnvC (AmiA/AmiB activator)